MGNGPARFAEISLYPTEISAKRADIFHVIALYRASPVNQDEIYTRNACVEEDLFVNKSNDYNKVT